MYLLDQYRGTVLSCRYTLPQRLATESRTQIENLVKVAIVDTIMKHPMLQVGMAYGHSKTPSWIQLQSLDLAQHIKWVYVGNEDQDDFEQTFRKVFRIQIDERFPDLDTWAKLPGWKITVIRQGDAPFLEVLFTFNHPQFDGAGAKIWHEDFLGVLNATNAVNGVYTRADLDGDILKLPDEPPMLPTPLEDLVSLPLGPVYFAKSVWEEFRPSFLSRLIRDATQAAWCPVRDSPYKTEFRSFWIDDASLSAILGKLFGHNQ